MSAARNWLICVGFGAVGAFGCCATFARAEGRVPPEYLIQAEKNYHAAKATLEADRDALGRLLQEEAKIRRQAMAKYGSWIETNTLWTKRMALEQALANDRRRERKMKARLDFARDRDRRESEQDWSQTHPAHWFHRWWR